MEDQGKAFQLVLRTRGDVPMYTLRGYTLRGLFNGQGNIPVELQEVELPELPLAGGAKLDLKFTRSEVPALIRFEVIRPTGFSEYSLAWKP